MTVFLWGRSEAFVFLFWIVLFGLYAVARFYCIVVGILLWVLF